MTRKSYWPDIRSRCVLNISMALISLKRLAQIDNEFPTYMEP